MIVGSELVVIGAMPDVVTVPQMQREEWLHGTKSHAMRSVREKLPAHSKRQQVLDSLQLHRVVIISGATGCGKSTQLPQYILEQVLMGTFSIACFTSCASRKTDHDWCPCRSLPSS